MEDNKEKLYQELHEICREIVVGCKEQGKLNFRDEFEEIRFLGPKTWKEEEHYECDKELKGRLLSVLHELKLDLAEPEGEVLSIRKTKDGNYGIEYGGNGYDYDGYWQATGWIVDKVTEDEIKKAIEQKGRTVLEQKAKELDALKKDDAELDKELEQAKALEEEYRAQLSKEEQDKDGMEQGDE